MAKITDPDLLVLDTEIIISTASYTIQLVEAGNLIAEDGVTPLSIYHARDYEEIIGFTDRTRTGHSGFGGKHDPGQRGQC